MVVGYDTDLELVLIVSRAVIPDTYASFGREVLGYSGMMMPKTVMLSLSIAREAFRTSQDWF